MIVFNRSGALAPLLFFFCCRELRGLQSESARSFVRWWGVGGWGGVEREEEVSVFGPLMIKFLKSKL